jgi:hypothetical protein
MERPKRRSLLGRVKELFGVGRTQPDPPWLGPGDDLEGGVGVREPRRPRPRGPREGAVTLEPPPEEEAGPDAIARES